MNKSKPPRTPPLGIKPDYDNLFAVGTHGPIDAIAAFEVLKKETQHREERGTSSLQQSWVFVQEHENRIPFIRAYCAFREAVNVYPITKHNWHSGERIPLAHAWEAASEAVLLAFRAHYKSAYQRLREVLELIVLQQFFYTSPDKSIVAGWGRGEMRTPRLKVMLETCEQHCLYREASIHLGITQKILVAYDDLGAYIHTRGVPTTSMGLSGSNTLAFSAEALSRFTGFFLGIARLSIPMLGAFFPPAIIPVPSFRKLGHRHPTWLPRKDHVDCICSVLTESECSFLRTLAERNEWFQSVVAKVNALPDMTEEQIHQSFDELEAAAMESPYKVQELLKATNAMLE